MKIDANAPVGVFDSGLGGLTVVREIMRNLPEERIVYFGDTARVPYGNKSKETIIRYARQIVDFLRAQDVKAIVVACNTASALALETLEREIDIPILGVVKPGADMAASTTRNKRVGVIATESTIRSGVYPALLSARDPEMRVFGKACPLLVPLVEEGWIDDPVTETVARRYLTEILGEGIDTLVLGCTHYPLLRKLIGRIAGEDVTLVNPAYETALALDRLLAADHLRRAPGQEATDHRFYASDTVEQFNTFANRILPCEIETKDVTVET